ncbi:MAG: hypothetical protein LBS52_07920 [Dysgonamonadaceae bacterium]|jgi:hypothetical protein|nr:hypothetical protein [Dysgonamonadaceae bacterium]
MMRHRLLVLPVVCLLSLSAMAADSLSVAEKLFAEQQSLSYFRREALQNPALRFGLRAYSLTDIRLNGLNEQRGKASLAQEGDGRKDYSADVNSFVVLSDNIRLYGSASYRNGKADSVRWNENTDFRLLYPYVVGDSIGGFMKDEEYTFAGGLARRKGRWTIGAELSYRAQIAYRDKDPRPKNIVSDLGGSLSASRIVTGRYSLGVMLSGQKYSQKSEIRYLADKGNTPVYQMLGLGMDYVRFAGQQYYTQYNGEGVGATVGIVPTDNRSGFATSLRVNYFHLKKILTSLNYAPLNENNDLTLGMETSWIQYSDRWKYAVGFEGIYLNRSGKENIFGDPTGNVYPLMSSVNQLSHQQLNLALKAGFGKSSSRKEIAWTVSPVVAYRQVSTEYKANARKIDISSVLGGIEGKAMKQFDKFVLSSNVYAGFLSNLTNVCSLSGLNTTKSVGKALLANLAYLSDNCFMAALNVRADFAPSGKYAYYLSAGWQHQTYTVSGESNCLSVTLGCTF